MDDCASFSPSTSADFAFLSGLRALTELSWQDTAGAFAWMDPALHCQGGATALLQHAQHLTGLKRRAFWGTCKRQMICCCFTGCRRAHPLQKPPRMCLPGHACALKTPATCWFPQWQEWYSVRWTCRLSLRRQCMEPWSACLGAIASLASLTELDLGDTYASCTPGDVNRALSSLAALTALQLLDLSGTLAAEGLERFCHSTLV